MKIHYFGDNTTKKYYEHWPVFQTECGILINKEQVTHNRKDVTCGNCKKLLNLNKLQE